MAWFESYRTGKKYGKIRLALWGKISFPRIFPHFLVELLIQCSDDWFVLKKTAVPRLSVTSLTFLYNKETYLRTVLKDKRTDCFDGRDRSHHSTHSPAAQTWSSSFSESLDMLGAPWEGFWLATPKGCQMSSRHAISVCNNILRQGFWAACDPSRPLSL